jgi:hypothetical protein
MRILLGLMLATMPAAASLADVPEGKNEARIYVDDDRAGTANFSSQVSDGARIDEVDSRVTVGFLGFDVFEFSQSLRQRWKDGELVGTLNGEPVELPGEAFPTSVWHYQVTERPILFDVKDLDLRYVKVERSEEVIEIDGQRIPTERIDFVEGWNATLWYDEQQRLVQFIYPEGDHEVKVVPQRCIETAQVGDRDLPAC